jgi:acetyl-CoA carboxylase biotin carboxyl carrier protein
VADDASNNQPRSPRPFDVPMIRALVGLMSRNDLSEIDLCEGDRRIRLRRGPRKVAVGAAAPPSEPSPAPAAQPPPPAVASTEPAKPAKVLHQIKSPAVGTYYSAPQPGAEAFVHVGSRVSPTTVVGIIEAMKIFSEIPAECTGVITEILVENQQSVEYGQVLFAVDPTA